MAASKKGGKKAPKKTAKKQVKETLRKAARKIPSKKAIARKAAMTRSAALTEGTTLDELYLLDESDTPVTLEVNVGATGQTGDMTIKLDNSIITENLAGDFAETVLGSNKDLNGKKLSIVATISDTSRDTNVTSLNIRLKGGFIDENFLLSKEVENEGQSIDYLCLIEFFNPAL